MEWIQLLNEPLQEMSAKLLALVPNLIWALAVLLAGWIVALLVAASVRWALRKTTLDNRLAAWTVGDEKAARVDVERWLAKLAYYLVMLFVLVAFFQALNLTLVTEPLSRLLSEVLEFVPRLLGAGILLFVAWVAASVVRIVVRRVSTEARLTGRLASESGQTQESMGETIGGAMYWLVIILFIPAVLSTLELDGLLGPIQSMMNKALGFLPNLLSAAVILAVGWFIARILQQAAKNLSEAAGINDLGDTVGLSPAASKQVSHFTGLVVYALVLLPVIIAALNALQLQALTQPASGMLTSFLGAIPRIFAASLVLLIAYLVGRLVASLASRLLARAGFDAILQTIGLTKAPSKQKENEKKAPSNVVGQLLLVAILLLASMEAARLLEFASIAGLLSEFLVFGGHVILGIAAFGVGLFVANLAHRALSTSGTEHAALLATAARLAIVVLATAMGLRAMGFANEIVSLAFGLLLGAVAVAFALAFGLGSREIAGNAVKSWLKSNGKT
jgi:hypothetical protein